MNTSLDLSELVQLVHEQDSKIGIQLAHAGRKAEVPGDIIAPSSIAFNDKYQTPQEMTYSKLRKPCKPSLTALLEQEKPGSM